MVQMVRSFTPDHGNRQMVAPIRRWFRLYDSIGERAESSNNLHKLWLPNCDSLHNTSFLGLYICHIRALVDREA
jgi:hypothetical protein